MNTSEHVINRTCSFCGGNLYSEISDPDVIKCDTCSFTQNIWELDFIIPQNNIIRRAAHGSSGASELKAREA